MVFPIWTWGRLIHTWHRCPCKYLSYLDICRWYLPWRGLVFHNIFSSSSSPSVFCCLRPLLPVHFFFLGGGHLLDVFMDAPCFILDCDSDNHQSWSSLFLLLIESQGAGLCVDLSPPVAISLFQLCIWWLVGFTCWWLGSYSYHWAGFSAIVLPSGGIRLWLTAGFSGSWDPTTILHFNNKIQQMFAFGPWLSIKFQFSPRQMMMQSELDKRPRWSPWGRKSHSFFSFVFQLHYISVQGNPQEKDKLFLNVQ